MRNIKNRYTVQLDTTNIHTNALTEMHTYILTRTHCFFFFFNFMSLTYGELSLRVELFLHVHLFVCFYIHAYFL